MSPRRDDLFPLHIQLFSSVHRPTSSQQFAQFRSNGRVYLISVGVILLELLIRNILFRDVVSIAKLSAMIRGTYVS